MKTQWGCLHKTSSVYQVVGFIWCPPHPPHSPPTCTPNTIAAGALIHRSPLGRSGVQVLFITGQTQSWHMNRVFPSPNWQSWASHECYHKANESHYHLDNSNKMVCGLCIVTYLVQYSSCVCLDDKRIPKTSLQICKVMLALIRLYKLSIPHWAQLVKRKYGDCARLCVVCVPILRDCLEWNCQLSSDLIFWFIYVHIIMSDVGRIHFTYLSKFF